MNNLMNTKQRYAIDDLINVMKDLRTPETGCPWDLEQTFKTILPYTLEEAYEVADAIDRGSMEDLREELGDLLLQSVYHAQMASEGGYFNLHDVIHDVTAKMISRHPHVFGDKTASSAQDVDAIWEVQKNKEKTKEKELSALDGITRALPALLKAQKLQKKAAKVGFEWNSPVDVLDKLEEEIAEMRVAIENGDKENQEEELGDIIFLLANYARMLGFHAEEALRKCNVKFERRFRGLEKDIREQGAALEEISLEQKIEAWNNQKTKENKGI
ncbi:MAG: nucleoside triphosphate pyrophosphohydrolase [Alphaproteobacteria bacterium]|nr:nucleoside triphosphate pyrophosphohydrolase [Alphaproteobacteria bacterium]